MLSCNCLNITIEVEKNENVAKEIWELAGLDKGETSFSQDLWYVGRLLNLNKVHPGLVQCRRAGLWNVTTCLNCEVETHAVHKEKGASGVIVYAKLLNQEEINNIKSSDLISSIFHIIVNPNSSVAENTEVQTYHNPKVNKYIRDLNDVMTEVIRKEQAAVEERIKKYSDEQYEQLNILKDKAYKEREALVKTIQNAAKESNPEGDLSPKSPKLFGNFTSDKQSASNSPSGNPFSPRKPISTKSEKEKDVLTEDLMFDFDEYSETLLNHDVTDSENEDEESEEIPEMSGITIASAKSPSSSLLYAKSLPVDIPIFSHSLRSKNSRSEAEDGSDDHSENEQIDIAASIKALARSVHGDAIFGELPRPKFSTHF
ncbi:uncharacterized protein LOC126743153 [Anthonomus grandis grandis]|uniref:uncharacterized protein LOC126743153 n=1 Tax=Anthonomus grandis grandis TaxID=2921223 RepID=UPI002165A6BC|nr:uncharacterized protein LOC126743153 [Anthonomus grandis grandis]XP_050306084.1 uncharacterized protein LOC126743153 [Anthonomus grandis grandis]